MTDVVYLAGLGRSGSTLVERVLAESEDVCALGEVVHLWERGLRDDELCGCGLPFSRCAFWVEVGRRAFGGWAEVDLGGLLELKHRVDRNRHVPWLVVPALARRRARDVAAYVEHYERLYAAAAAVSGARVVVDSSKHASLAHCLTWSRVLRLRVVQVVRDSPPVAHSWSRTVQRPEVRDRVEAMPRWGAVRVALWWDVFAALVGLLRLRRTTPSLVRYEDVMADPRGSFEELAAHLAVRLGDDLFVDDRTVLLTSTHQVAGNPMRFRTGAVRLSSDDAWRTEQHASGRLLVSALTAPVRLLLGYPRPPGRRRPRAEALPHDPQPSPARRRRRDRRPVRDRRVARRHRRRRDP